MSIHEQSQDLRLHRNRSNKTYSLNAVGSLLVFLLIAFTAEIDLVAQAQTTLNSPSSPMTYYGDGYVLLQHGAVLQGFIKPQADSITIVMDKGKAVTIPQRQVLTIGTTKESLYKYQTKAIRKWGTGEHWHLAQWCIQNGLLDEAIEHYLELEKQAADNPKFKQLDLQLKQALLADERVRQAMLEQGIELPTQGSSSQLVDSQVTSTPKSQDRTETVGQTWLNHETPDEERLRLVSSFPVHTIPGYVRRSFQTDVTPIVVARCGQSGCHGMLAKNPFQIFQPVGDQAFSINERNLDKILRYIDADQPADSVLLRYATQAHGSQRNSSLNMNREEDRLHLERIAAWIRSLSSGKQSPPGDSEPSGVVHAANFAKDQTPTSNVKSAQAVKEIPNGKGSVVLAGSSETNTGRKRVVGASDPASPDRSAKLSKPPRSGTGSLAIDARDLAEIEDEIQRLEKIADKQSKKSDPFDAKIFNSKYSKGGGKPPPPLP